MPAAALLAAALALHAAAWRAGPVLAAVRVSTRPLVMAVRDWRLFGVDIPVLTEPAEAPTLLREAAARCLAVPEDALESITLVRRSLDARQQRTNGRRGKPTGKHEALWSHVIDVRISASAAKRIKVKPGRCVPVASERASEPRSLATPDGAADAMPAPDAPHVVVIGAGPCGLFAALELCRAGVRVTLCERGKPVEERGRSIGALVRRGMVDPESNFCYGEGGAGTWSDGKLTTRIGRNSVEVRQVLETLVNFGAPARILTDGAPHLGTDNLVRLLKNFRAELLHRGARVMWDARVEALELADVSTPDVSTRDASVLDASFPDVSISDWSAGDSSTWDASSRDAGGVAPGEHASAMHATAPSSRAGGPPAALPPLDALRGGGVVTGVRLASGERLRCDAVVVAAGHSARELYSELLRCGATLQPKDFAAGFRIEHPQELINRARYGELASFCAPVQTKAGAADAPPTLPPADYKLATNVTIGAGSAGGDEDGGSIGDGAAPPPPPRGVYSFCMCPGGQIVPTSLDSSQLCVNGMSYSTRGSAWANSAVVATVGATYGDFDQLPGKLPPPLAGLEWQEEMEARAAQMGGGQLRCPVQRVSDFLAGRPSVQEELPPSSYRLGVTAAPLHQLYPPAVTAALRQGIAEFGRRLPGFDAGDGLLHAVETRTSAPVQVVRHAGTCEAVGLRRLYPAGEGAGYAGGIVSAAVDGLRVARALLPRLAAGHAKAETH